jgi:xylose dehydrogenase (NAD/NADP)
MSKVRWGVIGCANFARRRTIPALLQAPSVELVGVASRTPEKAEEFRKEFGLPRAFGSYEELIADPEIQAVYIPLPNGLHAEWMVKAARAGIHSLTEKPFASNAEEARAVSAVAAQKGVLVTEGFMWRLHQQHQAARAAIDAGAIGPVRLVRSSFTFKIERMPNVRLVPSLAGGSVMDVGCYPISAARFYLGGEPQSVFARGDVHPEHGVDVRVSGILEFPNGRALFDCGFDLPFRASLEVVGEAGTIQIPKPWLPDPEALILINGEQRRFAAQNQYVSQFELFSRCILDGGRPPYGPEDAVRQMAVIDAVLRSVRCGKSELVDGSV